MKEGGKCNGKNTNGKLKRTNMSRSECKQPEEEEEEELKRWPSSIYMLNPSKKMATFTLRTEIMCYQWHCYYLFQYRNRKQINAYEWKLARARLLSIHVSQYQNTYKIFMYIYIIYHEFWRTKLSTYSNQVNVIICVIMRFTNRMTLLLLQSQLILVTLIYLEGRTNIIVIICKHVYTLFWFKINYNSKTEINEAVKFLNNSLVTYKYSHCNNSSGNRIYEIWKINTDKWGEVVKLG